MAAVFEEVTLGWGGQEYKITPTMKLLNTIEQEVSLSRLAWRMADGDAPMSHLATVIGTMLRHGGARCDDDEVYQLLMTGDPGDVQKIAGDVMAAVFPQPKKSEAPSDESKAKK